MLQTLLDADSDAFDYRLDARKVPMPLGTRPVSLLAERASALRPPV
jgi:hypothetical protein